MAAKADAGPVGSGTDVLTVVNQARLSERLMLILAVDQIPLSPGLHVRLETDMHRKNRTPSNAAKRTTHAYRLTIAEQITAWCYRFWRPLIEMSRGGA